MLEIENLTVTYESEKGTITALENISLSVQQGELVGIVGESGCGKSTFLHAIQRILPDNAATPTGSIKVDGRDLLALEKDEFKSEFALKKIAYIPQAAMSSLDPVYTIRTQLQESMRAHVDKSEMGKKEINNKIDERIENMGMDISILEKYPHELSGGQLQRVVIANAFLFDPDIVLADEPTTGLDLLTQHRILEWLEQLHAEKDFSLILVSHDIPMIAQTSEKLGVFYAGEVAEFGNSTEVFKSPAHPYTMGLIESTTHVGRETKAGQIEGSPPSMIDGIDECKFRNRCPFSYEECRISPPLEQKDENHFSACHLDSDELEAARNKARVAYSIPEDK